MKKDNQNYLLGIDVGTTGTKTMLFSQDGKCLGHAYQAYETNTPDIGLSEQNPHDWWNAIVYTVRQVCGSDLGKSVMGISLSVQGGTTVPVDKEYEPVRPAIVWNDSRCSRERDLFLNEIVNPHVMYRKTGWHLSHGMNALQIRWLKDHEPENFQKTAMFLSVPDYLSYRMTGIPAIDPSNIGINQLGNVLENKYDRDILSFSGIREEQLPTILPSGKCIGPLTAEAAKELGLTTECVLVAGAHDQYAAALGAGMIDAGDILIGSGTSWVVTCIKDIPDFESGLSQSVSAVPGKWGSLWSLSSGGVCMEWLRKNILGTDNAMLTYERINEQVKNYSAAEDGLFFYPFSGRASLNQDFSRGTFVGLDLSHDKYHLLRAVMEGVAFQSVWMMDSFHVTHSNGIKLSGGASKSDIWCQMVADIANMPVRIPEVADLACVGAAVLAGMGSGIFRDVREGYEALAVKERVIFPDPEQAKKYSACFEEYKRIAGHLGNMHR